MHVLIPDDPVLAASFLVLEQPLFHSLHYLYRMELTASQANTIGVAYESWGQLQQMLPSRFHAQTPDAQASEEGGYVLEDSTGQRLTTLHLVDAGRRISDLETCYMMLRQAQLDSVRGPLDPLADVLREIDDGINLVGHFRRVLQVLRLPSPPQLLAAVRRVAPRGPATPVTLNPEQEREYRDYCEAVVGIFSGNDIFAYTTHRALYSM
ncbi:hypothetical protein GCM10018980_71340 [Streptomyces capoamus]|uniref:Uncharacterized protein n=1 Tax=Streptomyces capoamus TaxID=68183 RepID=A0A919F2Y9_9ACTN|nr:hypothetical protein [Streptomyces capoamus]GGW13219.1 hypothetical protein GCM10010501_15890 [Streptomyces libani subsp. rufus]GHG74445.1 hypothetical protein GCM10018980_71340 [Streptomyces capoamus]